MEDPVEIKLDIGRTTIPSGCASAGILTLVDVPRNILDEVLQDFDTAVMAIIERHNLAWEQMGE